MNKDKSRSVKDKSKDKSRSVKDMINIRNDYQNKFIQVLKKYFIKYIKSLYMDSVKNFQEKLLEIPYWSEDKTEVEYNKFIIYTELKFDLNEDELSKIIEIIIGLNMKILNTIFYNINVHIPTLLTVWYKCLKKIAKFYYENPTMIKSQNYVEEQQEQMTKIITNIIQKFIPIKHIIETVKNENIVKDMKQFDDEETADKDADKRTDKCTDKRTDKDADKRTDKCTDKRTDKSSDKGTDKSKNKSSSEYTSSDEDLSKLNKISSKSYYYESDEDINEELSEEKLINLPRYMSNKKFFYNNRYSKPAKNEIDENFFDEF